MTTTSETAALLAPAQAQAPELERDSSARPRPRVLLAALATACWLGSLLLGLGWLVLYETTPGPSSPAPSHWPAASGLAPPGPAPSLLLFVHPECRCTRASLVELNVILNDHPEALATVLFAPSKLSASQRADTEAWRRAGELPHTTRIVDEGGREAQLFGAQTSGHVIVFDSAGLRQFSGGITGSRGHSGDNVGERSAAAALAHLNPLAARHPVYGCSLLGPTASQEQP